MLPLISRSRRRRAAVGLALFVAVVVVIGVVVSTSSPGSTKTPSSSGTAASAATVQRRDLVETDTESGTLSYANPQTVYDRLSGTITWLPSVGQVIKPGGTLYKIGDEPVILMNGTTPAYRDLSAADSDGADILQLNRNLADLGFNPDGIVIGDQWQTATTAGVEALQASLGQTETGSLSVGQIVFLPGDQLVATVDATLGSNGSGGSSSAATSSSDPSAPASASDAEFVSLDRSTASRRESSAATTATATATACPTTTTTTTTTATSSSNPPTVHPTTTTTPCTTNATPPTRTPKTTPGSGGTNRKSRSRHSGSSRTFAALIALLKAEIAQLKAEIAQLKAEKASSPATGHGGASSGGGSSGSSGSGPGSSGGDSGSSGAGSGSGGGSASAILQTTSTQLVVTVDLDATKQSEAIVGEPVTVEMPAGNTVTGKITAVSPVAQSSSNSGSGGSGGSGSSGSGSGSGGGGSSGSSSTVPVTVTLNGHHAGSGLDQAAVSVNFEQQKATNVLSVPVTALLATSGGGYAVQEAAAPYKLVPVTTGLFAAGYVEISGSGIYPGLQVSDSQG